MSKHNQSNSFSHVEQNELLLPLLDYLDNRDQPTEGEWQGWEFGRISGGANNILFRAIHDRFDCAIKFTIRDSRNRAEREYNALKAVGDVCPWVAPIPLFVDHHRFSQPVVVQSWLDGDVTSAVPETDSEWLSLLQHYATIHTVTPDKTKIPLSRAFLNADCVQACQNLIRQQLIHIPWEAQPDSLQALIPWLDTLNKQDWPMVPPALCRVDANISNFVRRPGAWASVDWENSGWGDPAFEIADLMTHPAYLGVQPARWKWVMDTYCDLRADVDQLAAIRILLYYNVMLLFWVIRLARTLYEVPRGLDQRLVARPNNWVEETQRKYNIYLNRAEQAFRSGEGWH